MSILRNNSLYICLGNSSKLTIKLIFSMIEVQVYVNLEAFNSHKSVFGRMVQCPDVFDFRGFESSMRSVFGNDCVTVYKCTK